MIGQGGPQHFVRTQGNVRTFVATSTPSVSRELEQVMEILQTIPNVKVVDWGQLHLTLRFLGQTDTRLVPQIAAALTEIAERTAAFTLTCRGIGSFPNARSPRVVWAGVDPLETLSTLAADIETACAAMGFRKDRHAFHPHVTLARIKEPRDRGMKSESTQALQRLMATHAATHFFSQRISTVTLYQTELTPSGARYTAITEAALGR